MRVSITDDCIRCGACEALAPDYFEMGEKKARVKKPFAAGDVQKIKEVCDACPVNAIKLEE